MLARKWACEADEQFKLRKTDEWKLIRKVSGRNSLKTWENQALQRVL